LVNFLEDGLGFGVRLFEGEEGVLGLAVAVSNTGKVLGDGGRGELRFILGQGLLELNGRSVRRD
jgi:hypothetical protein